MTAIEAAMNTWRLETPGAESWARSARPDDPDKLLLVSSDCHANEPPSYLKDYIEPGYEDRIPRLEVRDDGSTWMISEGWRPALLKPGRNAKTVQEQQSFEKTSDNRHSRSKMDEEDLLRSAAGKTIEQRLDEQAADGIDIELVFPNKGLICFATQDPVFADAMCRAWNRWAYDWFGGADGWNDGRTRPLASIATGDPKLAMAAAEQAAELGFVGLSLGNSRVFGPKHYGNAEYNDDDLEPFWSLTEELGLPITFHVSTGRDPRTVGGNGGAIINYVCHSMETTMEPMVQLITSGVFERHPNLKAGMVESGIGFVPWLLDTMDHAYRAHHMHVRPVIPDLPSEYFRRNCFATFQYDQVGLDRAEELDLVENYMWANDYPHHEGSWPHSAAAVEKEMANLSDESRAKILGENAARVFNL